MEMVKANFKMRVSNISFKILLLFFSASSFTIPPILHLHLVDTQIFLWVCLCVCKIKKSFSSMRYVQKKEPTEWSDSEVLSPLLGIRRHLWDDFFFPRVCNCPFYPILSRSKGAGRETNIWVTFVTRWSERTCSRICWWRREEGNRSFPRGWNKSVWLIKATLFGIAKRNEILDPWALKWKLGRFSVIWPGTIPLCCAWICANNWLHVL